MTARKERRMFVAIEFYKAWRSKIFCLHLTVSNSGYFLTNDTIAAILELISFFSRIYLSSFSITVVVIDVVQCIMRLHFNFSFSRFSPSNSFALAKEIGLTASSYTGRFCYSSLLFLVAVNDNQSQFIV